MPDTRLARPQRASLPALFAALPLALALCACDKPAPPPPPAAVPVSTLKVATREIPVLIEAVGRTEGSKEVEVRARVSGILEKINFAEGTPVKAGTPLYRIDRAPFEIALAEARAALQQEQARHEQAGRERNRLAELASKRAISQRESDDAGTTLKTSQATMSAAEAKVREAELNLSYTTVTAPVAGVTSRNQRSEGTLVTANTDSALLTTISQTNPMWVRFGISDAEYEILRSHAGGSAKQALSENPVRLILPSGKTYPVEGKLNFSGSTVDNKLGTVQLRAEFANADLGLLPGQYVKAQVVAGKQQAILVPQTAVQQNEQGRFVWVVGPENKAMQKRVEAGNWLGPDWIINKGLNDGDVVILDNLLKVRPGGPVKLQEAAAPAGNGAAGNAPAAAPADAKKAG
ncbi:MAG TPA: efflux RND transporter periplasmic adaptor subunit [Burkholderiales bacterium]